MHEEHTLTDRRAFLKQTLKIFGTILSVSTGFLLFISSYPGRIRKKEFGYHRICDTDELPVKGVRQFYLEFQKNGSTITSKVFIVNNGDEVFALSPVCTHLGCLVNWNRHKRRFLCPCHGGQYDMNGNVIEGPPPASLGRLPMKTDLNDVLIGLRI